MPSNRQDRIRLTPEKWTEIENVAAVALDKERRKGIELALTSLGNSRLRAAPNGTKISGEKVRKRIKQVTKYAQQVQSYLRPSVGAEDIAREPRLVGYTLADSHGKDPVQDAVYLELIREISYPCDELADERRGFGPAKRGARQALEELDAHLTFLISISSNITKEFDAPRGQRPDRGAYSAITAISLEYEAAGGKIQTYYNANRDLGDPDDPNEGWKSPFVLYLCALSESFPNADLPLNASAMAKLADRALKYSAKKGRIAWPGKKRSRKT